ncbi:MAG: hypothetical protein KF826_04665 [Xanthobacteraceae bacterium]|nr:hypothetical protein [Xanthobacteraceae bacterium]MBX3533623.1 hypothetical protein [Xanthobacteraceae bacterium]MCW5675738.1 hypothetical protein [Xanthobacteraceae bacterium]MCW5679215.1 hypothetical protein [Xanthobacteraceae bacterium]
MPADQEHDAQSLRYVYYTLAAMTAAAIVTFLYLFNYTNFFKLAVPL